jgi:penicillin-insensitive murein endopeptidase
MRSLAFFIALVLAAAAAGGVLLEQEAAAISANARKHLKRIHKRLAKPSGPPARELFGAARTPALMAPQAIGFYAKGCLAGGTALPIDGAAWQVMRLSRNRNWGHPELIALIEKLALEASEHDGWLGLLVGDISQPRGGPMLTGHASHQVGLDADIWLTPMPNRRLSPQEREGLSATSMVAADRISVDPNVWSEAHVRLLKRAASFSDVERIFVNPAIKKALCDATSNDGDRAWLRKVRPYWGHDFHFHMRLSCPKDSLECVTQPPASGDEGCGEDLTHWLALVQKPPKAEPPAPAVPSPARRNITLDQLPSDCRTVLGSEGEAKPAPAVTETTATVSPQLSVGK